jgi:hypothetical protein
MKLSGLLLILVCAVSCAEEKVTTPEKKRLESVTWDLQTHKLVWVVESGKPGPDGKLQSAAKSRYEISPDDAVMAFHEERRGFTTEEAAALHKLLDTLTIYCVESVTWWDNGQGEPLDGKGNPNRQKVRQKDKPAPKPVLPRDVLLAALARQ